MEIFSERKERKNTLKETFLQPLKGLFFYPNIKAMQYYLITYGCQMNVSDSERIATTLENKGLKPALDVKEADLIVVNMCSVRQSAVDRVYGFSSKFKKLRKGNPNLKTVLTGCVLKKDKEKLSKIFDDILDIKNLLKITPKYTNNFSASLPIMTGCNNFCAFCVVPQTKGREISRPAEEIISEVKSLVKKGYKEIWLLGQNVNSYKSKAIKFPELLKIINKIPGEFWVRFTSPHPKDFSNELIDAIAEGKHITPYLNLPVQSGDNEILKKMKRPYAVEHYKNLVKKVREKIPGICISTDAIVGFPGETKKQFGNTSKLFRETKFDMAYISEYSPRPGTSAALMKDNVLKKEKTKRKEALTDILRETALKNNRKQIGKTVKVLISRHKENFYIGKTEDYKTIKIIQNSKKDNLTGKFVKAVVIDALAWGLKGELK